jgi:hypothetical protein
MELHVLASPKNTVYANDSILVPCTNDRAFAMPEIGLMGRKQGLRVTRKLPQCLCTVGTLV